jgi:hypothetical protein
MNAWEAFLLGMMVAYTPSLAVAALLLHHAAKLGGPPCEEG